MTLIHESARIVANEQLGPKLFVMTLHSPQIAGRVEPGQFVHAKLPGMEAHILRRPFSVYAADATQGTIEILYQAVGFGTEHMTTLPADAVGAVDAADSIDVGDDLLHDGESEHDRPSYDGAELNGASVEVIGPIGRGWQPPDPCRRALIVAGGVGAAPVFLLAKRLLASGVHTDIILGAQSASALVARPRYEALLAGGTASGIATSTAADATAETAAGTLICSTDDGSYGRAGFCTLLVEEALAASASSAAATYDYLACCGPDPLMRAVTDLAIKAQVPHIEVSLERRMACGVGACLSCVVDTVDGKQRSCVDGPVFDARKVVW